MSGTKTGSQSKSSSTGEPSELKTPQEVTDYTSGLPGLPTSPEEKPEEPEEPKNSGMPEDLRQQISALASQGVTMPRIRVIEDGKETVGELDVGLITMVTQLGQLGQLNKIRKSLEREQFKGKLVSKTLDATEEYQAIDLAEQDPFHSWLTATFVNKGPDSVKLAINHQRPYHTLDMDDPIQADFTKAEDRIYFIEYLCDPGETATVRVLGKY